MSVTEGSGSGAVVSARKPGGAVLIFMPALIAVLALAAILLGSLPRPAAGVTGYGIDEMLTGSITAGAAPPNTTTP